MVCLRMSEHPSQQKRRIRLLYSMRDIRIAMSAADFLYECDPDEAVSSIDLRRYKCYETTAIIAYARPFSESVGGFPKLSFKMVNLRLDARMLALHNKLIELRNQVIAHSDAEMMRMAVRLDDLEIGADVRMPLISTVFDEGLDFVGFSSVSRILDLFHTVHFAIYETLMDDARRNPEKFNFRFDYLNPDD